MEPLDKTTEERKIEKERSKTKNLTYCSNVLVCATTCFNTLHVQAVNALVRLHICAGSPESSLLTYATSMKILGWLLYYTPCLFGHTSCHINGKNFRDFAHYFVINLTEIIHMGEKSRKFKANFQYNSILSVSEKLPVFKFLYFGKYIIQLLLRSCFWSTTY